MYLQFFTARKGGAPKRGVDKIRKRWKPTKWNGNSYFDSQISNFAHFYDLCEDHFPDAFFYVVGKDQLDVEEAEK